MKLLLFIILILPIQLIACSCITYGGPLTINEYNNSKYIISGKATKVILNYEESIYRQRQIEFEIDEIFKGKIESKKITIYTALGDAACGLFVNENEEWVIYAYMHDGVFSTNLCTRSQLKKKVSSSDYKSLKQFKNNSNNTEWKNNTGSIIAVGKLENNMPIGYWKYYYNNGYLESEGSYKNGEYDGKWIKYLDPEGIVTRLHYDKKIPQDSTPDLQLLSNKVSGIENYKEGIGDGEFIYYAYYSFDKPTYIMNYRNGKKEGKEIRYYGNGIINYEQNFHEGELEGYERFYYKNGQLKQEGKFIKGKPSGRFNLYSESGELIKTTFDQRPNSPN
jgi:antitoxin component YwqK of YwqJK toxin-antitoxin module